MRTPNARTTLAARHGSINPMATEIELKFRIPAQRLAVLRRAVATRQAEVLPLAAAYFDTPGEHLARARTALRLRREGAVWVQTLKAEGAGPLQRLEHNVPLVGSAQPALDIRRHDGSDAGAALRRVLVDAGAEHALVQRYTTSVQRTRRLLRSAGALIELALDEGEVRAGDRSLRLCEIEFELLRGPPQVLLALAGRWVARHGLLLDVRSKSELGHNLAAGLDGSPPCMARPLAATQPGTGAGAGTHAGTEAGINRFVQALRVVLANASQLAAGPAQTGHLQQLRLGLQHLCLRLGADLPGPGVAALLGSLGAADHPLDGPQALLRRPATQQLWLQLLGFSLPAD